MIFRIEIEKSHYFEIGADAVRLIVSELIRGFRNVPHTILDFPCGAGRVTRHLRAFFPDSRVFACDLYDQHVDFCVNELGAEGIISKENFDELDFGRRFDLLRLFVEPSAWRASSAGPSPAVALNDCAGHCDCHAARM
jgi:SAM-dependent methyltransferase